MSRTIWMRGMVVTAVVLFAACFSINEVMGEPVFNPDGSISCGENNISLDKNGSLTINAGHAKISGRIAFWEMDPETKERGEWFTATSLENKSLKVDVEEKYTLFKGIYNHEETGKSMEVCILISLGADGMVNVEYVYSSRELFKEKLLGGGYSYLTSPYDNFIGETVKIGDEVITFEKGGKPKSHSVRGEPDKIIYFADNPSMRITFLLSTGCIHFSVNPSGGVVHLSLGNCKVDLGVK